MRVGPREKPVRRREFISLIGGAAAWPIVARAQTSLHRIGFLASGAAESANSADQIDLLKQGFRENGLVEARDYMLEVRFAAGDYGRFPELARELAQAGVSVIMANTIASVRAAQRLTPPVPVVMLSINDPVGAGLVASLARPGGHTSGMATLGEDLTPKLLEFERAIVPKAKVIAVLFNPANPTNLAFLDKLRTQAEAIGLTVLPFALKSPDELDAVFASLAERTPGALQIIGDSGTFDLSDRIAALALAHMLPTFTSGTQFAKWGGLLAYGASRRQKNPAGCGQAGV